MSPRAFGIRPATPADREAIVALLRDRWGGETMVVHDTVSRPADLPAFVAIDGPDIVRSSPTSRDRELEVLSLAVSSPVAASAVRCWIASRAPRSPLALLASRW